MVEQKTGLVRSGHGPDGQIALGEFDSPPPSLVDALGASFRRENTVPNMVKVFSNRPDYMDEIDPEFNPFENVKGYEQEEKDGAFNEVFNRKHHDAVKAQIDQQRADQKIRGAYDGWMVGLDVFASIADPVSLIPGAALVRGGRIGYKAGKSALAVGASAAGGTAVQESILQAAQPDRTTGESAVAIGGSVVLGALLGAGVAKLLTAKEWHNAADNIAVDLMADNTVPDPIGVSQQIVQRMSGLSADAVEQLDLSDLGVGGNKAAQILANVTASMRINPGIQLMHSPSKEARAIFGQLNEASVYTGLNMKEGNTGAAVESMMYEFTRGRMSTWIKASKKEYKAARKTGFAGKQTAFNIAVSAAARNNDVALDGNIHVTNAARMARKEIFDPLLKRAQEAGLLPADVSAGEAQTYVTRLWNREILIAREHDLNGVKGFRNTVRPWFVEQFKDAQFKQEEIGVARDVADYDAISDKLVEVEERLNKTTKRVRGRKAERSALARELATSETGRLDALAARPPEKLRLMLADPDANEVAMDAARTSFKGKKAPRTRQEKYPVIETIKSLGGVRKGSVLEEELKNMGVTAKAHPGLFKKTGGIGDVDNLPLSDHPILNAHLYDEDGTGYAPRNAVFNAVADEMAGSPLMMEDLARSIDDAEQADRFIGDWLEAVGLPSTSTLGDIRKFINKTTEADVNISKMDTKINKLRDDIARFDDSTDSVLDGHKLTDAEAKSLKAEVKTLEDKIAANIDLIDASPRIARMVNYAKAKRDLSKARIEKYRARKIADGAQRVPLSDRSPNMHAKAAKAANDIKTADKAIEKHDATVKRLKPTIPKERPELNDIIDPEDMAGYIEEAITETFNNLTGRGDGSVPDWVVAVKRGPLAERTFKIPDKIVEGFLENDMEAILRQYTRIMSADIGLKEKFGSPDMAQAFERMRMEYTDLAKAATSEAERTKLDKAFKRDKQNLEAFRDLLRGTYKNGTENSVWSRMTRAALTWNYIRLLGGVTMTSLTDVSRPIAVHGMRATMREALPALIGGTRALKISKKDASYLGPISEVALQTRLTELAGLQDQHAAGSVYERFLSNASHAFSKATGLSWWNDTLKMISSVMTQNRMSRTILNWNGSSLADRRYMNFLGINEDMAARMKPFIETHGVQEKGVWGANVMEWDDPGLVSAWAAALNKDVNRTVVTPGVSDKPLFMNTNAGALVMQFKSFGMASHQKILIAGMQENPTRLAESMVFASTLGMMISYLKLIERGDTEGADRLLNNPGLWVANGLDRSGIMSIPFDISNTMEKLGSPIGIASGVSALAGDEDRSGGVSRYASRNELGAVLGPSAGAFQDIVTIGRQLAAGDVKKGGANAMIRQIPGGTLPGVRTGLHTFVKPAIQDLVE